tara:strand:- start:1030 stop:1851 length:822 start_codon:yes stop_codon:yes gene_type:complete
MQGNLLFVGCSHTNGFWGYVDDDKKIQKVVWDENNYAQIYADELAEGQCYIYASAGACNQKYARWIRHMLNIHDNISGVVIQSTYWDRWLLANNINLEFTQLEPGHFTQQCKETDNFILYDDVNTVNYNEIEWNEKVKWASVAKYEEGCPENHVGYEWPGFDYNYMHIKFHTEINTHLKHDEYCKDIALIDAMCNVPVYVWRINDRVQFPVSRFDTFGPLKNVKVFDTPANVWIKENLDIDIDIMTKDQEHYNVEAHKLIAHHFIPEVLHASK